MIRTGAASASSGTIARPQRATTRLLIVDDDGEIRCLMAQVLASPQLDVTVASDVHSALATIRSATFDIVVLDLRLPDGSGLEVLSALREAGSEAHVLVLTGATAEADRVEALDRGADDVVAKPFSVLELKARIAAVCRRRGSGTISELRFGDLELTLATRQVSLCQRPLTLTNKEFDLLAYLATHPDHAYSRDELLHAVWRSTAEWQQAATVTEHIRRLRGKVERDPAHPALLRTVQGVGYRFDPTGAGT